MSLPDLAELPPFVDSATFAEVLGCARGTVWAAWRDEGGVIVGDQLVRPVRCGRALRWPTGPIAALSGMGLASDGLPAASTGARDVHASGAGPPGAEDARLRPGALTDIDHRHEVVLDGTDHA